MRRGIKHEQSDKVRKLLNKQGLRLPHGYQVEWKKTGISGISCMSGAADYSLQIGSNLYRLRDLQGKTLYAAKPLTIYNTYAAKTVYAQLKKGDPLPGVLGFVEAGHNGATKNYLLVGASNAQSKAVEYAPGNFDESKLKAQGVKTSKDNADEDKKLTDDENTPWYSNVISSVGPWALGGLALWFAGNEISKRIK